MTYLRTLVIATAVLLNAGCTTIVFDNGPNVNPIDDVKVTHHIGAVFELGEFSRPQDLNKHCEGNFWKSVTTKQTFGNGLVRQIIPYGIYAPRTVYIDCAD